METGLNAKRKWSYKSDSPSFKKAYLDIADMISEIIGREITEFCTDIGGRFKIQSIRK